LIDLENHTLSIAGDFRICINVSHCWKIVTEGTVLIFACFGSINNALASNQLLRLLSFRHLQTSATDDAWPLGPKGLLPSPGLQLVVELEPWYLPELVQLGPGLLARNIFGLERSINVKGDLDHLIKGR
jgi:hypothetical protein